MTVLKDALARHPDDRAILGALISFSRNAGDLTAALQYAERLATIMPDNRELATLIDQLRRAAVKPGGQ
jgi:Flp pilus assembly protein TadD